MKRIILAAAMVLGCGFAAFGTIDGQPFSESAVVWYEPDPNEATRAYLVINSFSLGAPITYVLTLDLSVPFTTDVREPGLPVG